MSSTYKITFALAVILSLSFPLIPSVRADNTTRLDNTLACKKLVTFSMFDAYMRVGNQSGLIRTVMRALQIGDCVILPLRKPLTPVDYAEDKICFKFEGSGDDCMWIRKDEVREGATP